MISGTPYYEMYSGLGKSISEFGNAMATRTNILNKIIGLKKMQDYVKTAQSSINTYQEPGEKPFQFPAGTTPDMAHQTILDYAANLNLYNQTRTDINKQLGVPEDKSVFVFEKPKPGQTEEEYAAYVKARKDVFEGKVLPGELNKQVAGFGKTVQQPVPGISKYTGPLANLPGTTAPAPGTEGLTSGVLSPIGIKQTPTPAELPAIREEFGGRGVAEIAEKTPAMQELVKQEKLQTIGASTQKPKNISVREDYMDWVNTLPNAAEYKQTETYSIELKSLPTRADFQRMMLNYGEKFANEYNQALTKRENQQKENTLLEEKMGKLIPTSETYKKLSELLDRGKMDLEVFDGAVKRMEQSAAAGAPIFFDKATALSRAVSEQSAKEKAKQSFIEDVTSKAAKLYTNRISKYEKDIAGAIDKPLTDSEKKGILYNLLMVEMTKGINKYPGFTVTPEMIEERISIISPELSGILLPTEKFKAYGLGRTETYTPPVEPIQTGGGRLAPVPKTGSRFKVKQVK